MLANIDTFNGLQAAQNARFGMPSELSTFVVGVLNVYAGIDEIRRVAGAVKDGNAKRKALDDLRVEAWKHWDSLNLASLPEDQKKEYEDFVRLDMQIEEDLPQTIDDGMLTIDDAIMYRSPRRYD